MIAEINGVNIKIKNCIPPVQGAVGIKMRASFSEEWSPLSVIAVFRAGTVQRDVIVEDGELTIPWEVLQKAGCPLYLNFYGADASGAVVLKTVQVELGTVAPSPDPSGEAPEAPTPARADQIQALAEEALAAAREVQTQAASGAFDGQDGADGRDGINGTNGTNGVSPRITVSETTGGHTVHITDAAGESSFDVLDGAPGEVSRAELASALATKADAGMAICSKWWKQRTFSECNTWNCPCFKFRRCCPLTKRTKRIKATALNTIFLNDVKRNSSSPSYSQEMLNAFKAIDTPTTDM